MSTDWAAAVGRGYQVEGYGASDPSFVYAFGTVIGYCDGPSVLIESEGGDRQWWRADLTRIARPTEPQGLGAVVEDDRGVQWVRTEKANGIRNPWQATLNVAEPDDIRQLAYAEIDNVVRVLNAGWSE